MRIARLPFRLPLAAFPVYAAERLSSCVSGILRIGTISKEVSVRTPHLIAKVAFFVLLLGSYSAYAQTFTALYSFNFPPDGGQPHSSLVLDSAGNLYGTTYEGGTSNWGAVFKLDTSGQESVLYSFAGPPTDGANPLAGLVLDSA